MKRHKYLPNGCVLSRLSDAISNMCFRDLNMIHTLTPSLQLDIHFQVINFYFNLLMDRSKKCEPSIHIFNTFFYPRLLKVGHQGLARWTRKVNITKHFLAFQKVSLFFSRLINMAENGKFQTRGSSVFSIT